MDYLFNYKMGDVFWIEKPKTLVDSTCLIPTSKMSTLEKLNTLSRLVIVISIAVMLFDMKAGIQFFVVGMLLLFLYHGCIKDKDEMNTMTNEASQAIGSNNLGLTLGYSDSYAPNLLSGADDDSLWAANNPNYEPMTDIGPRDPESSWDQYYTTTHSAGAPRAGIVGAIGNGGYGSYAPNANSNTALFVGSRFQNSQIGSLAVVNSDAATTRVVGDDMTRVVGDDLDDHDDIPAASTPRASYGVGGGWGHGWTPGTGLSFHPELSVAREGSVAFENTPGENFQPSQVDQNVYAELTHADVYSPYNTIYNPAPGQPEYLNTVYVSPAEPFFRDAGSGVPNAGTPGSAVDGSRAPANVHAAGAVRMAGSARTRNSYAVASNAAADSLNRAAATHRAGSTSDYSDNGYSNLYSGDSGNNDPEHYVALDTRQPLNRNGFINGQNIASYQPVAFTDPIDRSERLDAKTYQLWKDLTLFDQNPPRGEGNPLTYDAGTGSIADQSYDPTYYKNARRREEIKKSTFSSFLNERTAQDQGIQDNITEFRQQMMRDYTPLRQRPVSFRAGSNAPREFAAPGNVPLTPLRPPMTPSPATPGY